MCPSISIYRNFNKKSLSTSKRDGISHLQTNTYAYHSSQLMSGWYSNSVDSGTGIRNSILTLFGITENSTLSGLGGWSSIGTHFTAFDRNSK